MNCTKPCLDSTGPDKEINFFLTRGRADKRKSYISVMIIFKQFVNKLVTVPR